MPAAPRATLWRHRDFLLLWGGQAISQVGSQVTILALPLVAIVALHASTLQIGLLSATTTSAYLLVSLPAGVAVDRMSKRTLMLASDAAQIVVIGSVPLAYAAGVLSLAQLYVVALATSVLEVFFLVSYTSYLPVLVPPDQLMDGNGKLAATQSMAQIAGPGLGALLVGVAGAALAMGSDALSFAASAACLVAIRRREPRTPRIPRIPRTPRTPRTRPAGGSAEPRPGFRQEIGAGLSYVLREPVLRHAVAWNGSANFFVIMVETLGPLFLIRIVHLRPAYVGVLLALGAIGGVVAGVTAQPLIRRIGSARIAWMSMTVFALPGLLIPLAGPGWWVLLFAAGWISWTFSATLASIALTSYQQATCPPELRGRVSAAQRWINWGTLPLGGLAGGALGTTIGVHATLWLAVIGATASGLWLYLSPLRGQRDLTGVLRPAPQAR
ncbi:MAG TPA: MFS transporter [Streptosporangiaceae bacterium]|jgi:MFS family permease|nr:MFS transporter [Streptosporangiaceae bacterium]